MINYKTICDSLTTLRKFTTIVTIAIVVFAGNVLDQPAYAEYGDIVLNETSKAAGMNPVIFPHWVHRMQYSCRACHESLGFKMKVGTSGITMQKIFAGEYCAVCHNGKTAFATTQCMVCHSGIKGLPTQVHKSTRQTLVAPLE
ncbi:MAG: cytochrome c3 family protein [Gammaproteobacteria bacterium]|jgi:c(7)-type cytochrome triheme protein